MQKRTIRVLAVFLAVLMMVLMLPIGQLALAVYRGDANLNGKVQASDARSILRHAAKIELITDEKALALCDVDGNGKVNASDARLALRMASKMDPLIEVEDEPGEATTEAPATAEPTTAAPTTAEPTSAPAEPTIPSEPAEPTTAAPTTAEPTSEPAEPTLPGPSDPTLPGPSDPSTPGGIEIVPDDPEIPSMDIGNI